MAKLNPNYKYEKDPKLKGLWGKMKMLKIFLTGIFSLFLVLSIMAVSSAAEQPEKIVLITLNYNNNALAVQDMASGKGFVPEFYDSAFEGSLASKATITVLSAENERLYQSYFYIQNRILKDNINEQTGELSGGIIELNNISIGVIIPYFEKMDKIEIDSEYNDISLAKIREKYNIEKQISVPQAHAEKSEVKEDENSAYEAVEKSTDEDSEAKKSFFVELIEVVNSVWYYIFG